MDFAEARYFSSTQGRFTSADPFAGSMRADDPQSFNRYSYVGNNPVNRTDPGGMDWTSDASRSGLSQYFYNGCCGSSVDYFPTKSPRPDVDDAYDPEYSFDDDEPQSQQGDNEQRPTSTTPTALHVVSVDVLQICDGQDCGNPTSRPHGIRLAITYQVTGTEGAIRQAGLTPFEKVSPTRMETDTQIVFLVGREGTIGPNLTRNSRNTGKTDAKGQFVDAPFTIGSPDFLVKATVSQKIYFKVGNKKVFVRENRFVLTGTQDSKKKEYTYRITNGADISLGFAIRYK